jgi:hypothetical protein
VRERHWLRGLSVDRGGEEESENKEQAFHERIVYQLNKSLAKARVIASTTKSKR